MPNTFDKHLVDLSHEDPNPKMVIYGHEGARKTSFAGDAPDPIWIDLERSADTIGALIRKGHLPASIKALRPTNLAQLKEWTDEIVKGQVYKTIVIDTVTRLQKLQMREYIKDHDTVKRGTRDEYTFYQGDYNWSTHFLDFYLMDLMKAPIGVIIIAHEIEVKRASQGQNGIITYTTEKIEPNLTPALRDSLTELFSLVGYMTARPNAFGQVEHKLRVNPSPIIVAKNRLDIREAEITNPKYKEIFK